MTYKDLERELEKISPNEYSYEARILVKEYCGLEPSYIALNKDAEVGNEKVLDALKKRKSGVPLQYIIGKWDFYNQSYIVNENCLIPRSDTEILVQLAIEMMSDGARFLDLCTGSGCIAVSCASERKDISGIMVDKFPQTLDLAKINSELNGVSDRVIPLILDIMTDEPNFEKNGFDVILSNPPYIKREVISTLSKEVKMEPHTALDGGEDGLDFYRKIITDYFVFLKKNGFMLLEIGYDQGRDVLQIANENGLGCAIYKDYSGNDRVVKVFEKI